MAFQGLFQGYTQKYGASSFFMPKNTGHCIPKQIRALICLCYKIRKIRKIRKNDWYDCKRPKKRVKKRGVGFVSTEKYTGTLTFFEISKFWAPFPIIFGHSLKRSRHFDICITCQKCQKCQLQALLQACHCSVIQSEGSNRWKTINRSRKQITQWCLSDRPAVDEIKLPVAASRTPTSCH